VRYGVYVTGNNSGAFSHIILRNLTIHDINANPSVKTCGGIYFEIPTGGTTPAWFDSLLIEGCDIFDVSPVGIANNSMWSTRTLTTNTNWYPSKNIIVRNNTIRRTVRNGAIIRVSKGALVENNVFQECAKDSSGNALFIFNCDSTTIQYNEAFNTRYNAGDEDAAGFDADYRCKNTIIQYNYSHDNEYGGVVVVSDGNGATTFNDGTIVRYNVFKNNLNHIIRTSGNVTNTTFYNNTIYSSSSIPSVKVIWHKSWGGYSDTTSYYNNIFEIFTSGSSYSLGSSTNNTFNYNLFHGVHPSSEPADPNKLTSDPKFLDPSYVGNGWISAGGYRLQSSSPAINSGMTISGSPNQDYYGNPIPVGVAVDRGAFERGNLFTLTIASDNGIVEKSPDLSLYDSASAVQLIATANTGYHFMHWSGDATGSENPKTVLMNGNKTITAQFDPDTFTIIATHGPNGTITPSGTIKTIYGSSLRYTFIPDLVYLVDSVIVDGNKVDSTEGYTFSNLSTNHTISVTFKSSEYIIRVIAGWNMVSIPVTTIDYRKSFLFPSAMSNAYLYNNGYESKDTLQNGCSYWLKFDTSQSVRLQGVLLSRDTIDVVDGWNMIGSISSPVNATNVLTSGGLHIISPFYKYNSGYTAADTIYPGNGYWVKVNQPGSLILK
jgi:hypothetical protein